MKKATPSTVKLINRELIIKELMVNPKQSRTDLARKTRLSKPAVSEIIKELIEEGLVFESEIGTSTGGKKPILLEFNAKFKYVIGVIIENNKIYNALGDMTGEIIHVVKEKFVPPTDGEEIVEHILTGVKKLLSIERITPQRILGMAVGVSGILSETDKIISNSPIIHWGDLDLREELEKQLDLEIMIENDVNLMTIGESFIGKGKDIDHFVYLFIGNGIGSGLFVNGKFYKGFHSAAGEIGFMMMGDQSLAKPNLGVFEANYGWLGIAERLEKLGIRIDDDQSVIMMLQNQVENKKVQAILDDVLDHWAKAIINIISILDPEVIILSGEPSYLNPTSIAQLQSIIEKYVPRMPEFKKSNLGSKAGLYGAFHLVLNKFHKTGFKHN